MVQDVFQVAVQNGQFANFCVSLGFQSYLLRFGVWMVCFWGPVIHSHVWCLEA